jgi:hypothetical protein
MGITEHDNDPHFALQGDAISVCSYYHLLRFPC